jgi:RsiW-degrading membrane proteinase PrsW (M82 family)
MLAIAIAVLIPLAFLGLVQRLDLYASGSVRTVLACMGWGVVAFVAAYLTNNVLLRVVSYAMLVVLVAPIVEEIIKSLILVYYVRQPTFTYFVDGAIYGFAVGSTFGILENLLYLSRINSESSLALALTRAFSTSLMHGNASALVGIALGRLRFGRGVTRLLAVGLGWAAAIALHMAFNRLISQRWGVMAVLLAILVGIGGVILNIGFIHWGLREERRWLQEMLGRDATVSAGESAVVQQMAVLHRLLAPVGERFGAEKRQQVETFLRLQAQLGLKRKVEELTPDPRLRTETAAQIAALRREIDQLRRAIGLYCMSYVRSILPPETEPIWNRLQGALAKSPTTSTANLWSSLHRKLEDQTNS